MTKTSLAPERPETKLQADDRDAALQLPRSKQSFIQWPTEPEIRKVSEQLLKIQQVGIRCEADGDFFRSGDVAYQIQEIIRATADLSKKIQRAKG